MNSLFSSFDPMSSIFSMNFISMLIPLMTPLMIIYFLKNNRTKSNFNNMINFIQNELMATINSQNTKMKTNYLLTIFFIILMLNFLSLMPYVFAMTSHLLFTLSMSLLLWMSFLIFNMKNNTQLFLAHMVPNSTPMMLSQFMVIIESISQIIRPITLSVRLAANMTAGHILMALASNSIMMCNHMSMALSILLALEIAVAFIQSYVFIMLSTMYLSETK